MTHQTTTLIDHCVKVFSKLNGWSRTDKHFSFYQLAGVARGRRDNDQAPLWWRGDQHLVGNVMDHLCWFRYQRKPIALMSMPYSAELADAEALAELYGLEVYAPPIQKSGWWYPAWTDCYVFMRCGPGPRWLPQQCRPDAFKQYVAVYREAQAKDRRKYDEDQRRRAVIRAKLERGPEYNDQIREYMPRKDSSDEDA